MASIPVGINQTEATAQLAQMSPPQRWELVCAVNEQAVDTFQQLEGTTATSVVLAKTQEASDEGLYVNMKVRSGFYAEGKVGTETFDADTDFEKRRGISYMIGIGVFRHGSSYEEFIAKKQGIEHDLKTGTPAELGKWLGRKQFEQAAMTLRERTPTANRIFANGKTLESLLSTDYFDRNNVIIANGAMKRNGGGMADVGGAQVQMRTVAVAPSEVLTRLKLDPAYQRDVREARERGKSNPLWDSEVIDMDNCAIKEHNGLDHDGQGPVGSVFAPRGFLGTAIAAGTAVLDVTFGDQSTADTTTKFSKWFPGYNYTFVQGDTLAVPDTTIGTLLGVPLFIHGAAGTTENIATGGEHYLMIINPPTAGGAGEPANAIGFYAYTIGNNGNKITITARLGSATGGSSGAYRGRVTTLPSSTAPGYNGGVGVVTWGSGTYGGRTLTDAHPVGALVLPCNAKGVAYGWVPFMGAGALMRGYGQIRRRRDTQGEEGDFITKCWIRSYFGHRVRINRIGRAPAVQLMGCAIADPSLPLPSVTS